MRARQSGVGSVLVTILTITLAGCGGGGGAASEPGNDLTKTGVFLDSAVEGLGYSTESFAGTTDQSGRFQYKDGETIKFALGGVTLGETMAQEVITPIEVSGASNSADQKAINMLVFLQSLDADGNAKNGIRISEEAKMISEGLVIDFGGSGINAATVLTDYFGIMESQVVSDEAALGHFMSTIQNDESMQQYCDVQSDRYGSIFTTHTDDCKQRRYREAYYDLLLPIFYQLGQMSNGSILSTITVSEIRRDTVSQVLKAKKFLEYAKLLKATSTTGVSKAAVNAIIGETADAIGSSVSGSLGAMAGNVEYGDIWYGVLKSYADAPAAILGDPAAVSSLVGSQVDSLWKIGSDTLAAWRLNDLTEQSNELQITQYVLEYYYSNLTDKLKLLVALELSGGFDWGEVVDKVASLKGYENGLFSKDYSTDKVVQHVNGYIALVERIVNTDSLFVEAGDSRVAYQIDDGIPGTKVIFKGAGSEVIAVPADAYIRIVPRSFVEKNNYDVQITCKIQNNGDFENNCLIYPETRALLDNALSNPNETYQIVIFKNHVNVIKEMWECRENVYKSVGPFPVDWSNIEVNTEDFQDRSNDICY